MRHVFYESFQNWSQIYGKIRGGPLIENAQAFLMAAGWGTFELRAAVEGRFGAVTILDPPTLEGDVSYGNQFVEGIAAGLLEAASSNRNRMELVGEKYERDSGILSLHFAEQIPIKIKSKRPTSNSERKMRSRKVQRKINKESESGSNLIGRVPKTSTPVTEEAIEVERIIRSLEKIESAARTSVGEKQERVEENEDGGHLVVKPMASQNASRAILKPIPTKE
jgi:hypothetical protein